MNEFGMKPSAAAAGGAGVLTGGMDAGPFVDAATAHSAERDVSRYTRAIRICNVVLVVLALVLLALLWAIAGLCMRAGLLPYFDLGYSWFDGAVFVFFGLS